MNGGCFTGIKWQEHESDYSPLSTVKVNYTLPCSGG